jgi:hypothetical protein
VRVQGGPSQVFNAPFTSPQSFVIQGLYADGATQTVEALFSANPVCNASQNYTAPLGVGLNLPKGYVLPNMTYNHAPAGFIGMNVSGMYDATGGPFSYGMYVFDVDIAAEGVTDHAGFCIELAEFFEASTPYFNEFTVAPLEVMARGRSGQNESKLIPAGGIGTVKAGMVRWLFDNYYRSTAHADWNPPSPGYPTDEEYAAGFQMALWDIATDHYSSNNSQTVTTATADGFYSTTNSGSRTQAQNMLNALNALNWSDAQWASYVSQDWHVIALEANNDPGTDPQDMTLAIPLVESDYAFDFGDAPDTGAGTSQGNYNTTQADNGPNHLIVPNLRLGVTAPDGDPGTLQNAAATADDLNNIDDEDGVTTLPAVTTTSSSVPLAVSVFNNTGSPATVACWMDFNRDGDFLDAGERAAAIVSSSASQQTANLTFSGFAAPAVGTSYLRCRIATAAAEVDLPTGVALSGEVEDYQITISAATTDWGDLPDSFGTLSASNGPRHTLSSNLRVGACVDGENDGQPTANASGDDSNVGSPVQGTCNPAGDDEDGVTLVTPLNAGQQACVQVTATNTTGGNAYLYGWIDFNGDGNFGASGSPDPGELLSTGAFAGGRATLAGSVTNQQYCFTVPATALGRLGSAYMRFRLTSDDLAATQASAPWGGDASNGEVEDYLTPLGAIGNYVWVDENSDGYQDAGERGIPNVQINLKDAQGNVIATTYTDSHGGYLFPNLPAGSYFVDVVEATLPAGMTQTPFNLPGADFGNQDQSGTGYAVTIGGTQPLENLTADFGYNYNPTGDVDNPPSGATAALGDRVWIDVDGDGAQDPDEVGVRGVTVQLFTAGPDGIFGTGDDIPGATQVTDANGYYLFDGLQPGAYVVKVVNSATASHDVLGASYTQTGDPDHFGTTGTNNDNQTTAPVVLGPGDVFLNADFGYRPNQGVTLGTIGDTVWFDANASGTPTLDAGEYGIPGVTVALIRDTNGNGVWDVGEPIIATDTTNASGQYLFTGLSLSDNGDGNPADADYIVWVNDTDSVLTGLQQTYDQDAPLDNRSATALSAGTLSDLAQDFSYTAAGQTPTTGLIGDTVWFDLNNSGGATQQAGEPGIEGVVMELLDSSGNVIANTTTNENGNYYFGGLPVSAGGVQYRVRVAASNFAAGGVLQGIAETYAAGATVGGNQGNLVSLTTANPINLAQDFSYTATQTPGRIGNLVWLDSNANGVFDGVNGPGTDPNAGTDDDEPAIGGVTIDLYRDLNCNGRVDAGDPRISTQTTASAINAGTYGADGVYIFSRLATVGACGGNAAGYVVNVTDTAGVLYGYWHSLGAAGQNNNSQVDPYAAQISAGQVDNLTADFGYYVEPACLGNFVWYDQDGDGLQDAGEPGLNGVTLQLVVNWPAGGSSTLRTVSGDNPNQSGTQVGWYSFCNLLQDEDYRVGSSTTTPAANQPAHVASVATAPAGYAPDSIGGADGNEGTLPLDDSNNHAGTVAVPVQGLTNTAQAAAGSEEVIASYDFGYRAADWGDLPNSYNTTAASNGAYHVVDATNPTPRLGTCEDSEADGAPNASADGDDGNNSPVDFGGACTDDEDGVTAVNNWGDGNGHVQVTVSGASACLNAWMDFATAGGTHQAGGNGSFDYFGSPSEWIIQNRVMAVGPNQLVDFPLPVPFMAGSYYLRFRLTPVNQAGACDPAAYVGGSPSPNGQAVGGEVEDYRVDTTPLAVALASFDAAAQADHILVAWETVSEANNAGFNLYRSLSADGERMLLRYVPSAAPGATQGAAYSHQDFDVTGGQGYWYWLEAVDLNGSMTLFDPVSVVFQTPTAVALSHMDATSGADSSPWTAALAALALLALTAITAIRRRVAHWS